MQMTIKPIQNDLYREPTTITDSRDSPELLTHQPIKKKLNGSRDETTFEDKSFLSICENPYNILLQKHQQAPGATISSLVKFKSFI